MIFNCDIAWYDDKGRRHTTTIESDRTERDFIRQLVCLKVSSKEGNYQPSLSKMNR